MKFPFAAYCLALVAVLLPKSAFGWGRLGHQLIAIVAQQYISDDIDATLKELLPDDNGDISRIASWADSIKHEPGYQYTAPLHYVDTIDDPPNSCSFKVDRDCPDGNCVIGAIKGYAGQIIETSTSEKSKSEAVKFLVHFIGDIHQPLHVSGKERGGNNAIAYFNKPHKASLHYIWDNLLLQKRINDDFNSNTLDYVKYLNEMVHSKWAKEALEWTKCSTKLSISGTTVNVCPEDWAIVIDLINCRNVWLDYDPSEDLSGDYYTRNMEILDKLIVIGGLRLGSALTELLDGPVGGLTEQNNKIIVPIDVEMVGNDEEIEEAASQLVEKSSFLGKFKAGHLRRLDESFTSFEDERNDERDITIAASEDFPTSTAPLKSNKNWSQQKFSIQDGEW